MENNNDMNLEQNEELTIPETQLVEVEKSKFPLWVIPVAITIVIGIVMALVLPGMFADKTPDPVYGDYTVTIVDGLNNPMSNVVIKFTYPDGTTKSRITEADGTASIKNVELGDYKVTLEKGFSNAAFDIASYNLDKDTTSLTVVVRDETMTTEIYGDLEGRAFAYAAGTGTYDICTAESGMTYLVFNPSSKGIYRFSISSDNADATVGYYGIPMFVQKNHCDDGPYDGKSFEITIQDPASPYVIGVKAAYLEKVSLTIERLGDAPFDPQYAPWTTVPASGEIPKCNLPDGVILSDLDVTSKDLSVTLGDDGYYYTNSGELVYIRVNSVPNSGYLDVSIALIAGLVDKNIGQNFGGYVYDENGQFVGKYSYNEMLASYFEKLDSTGVYPLTQELAEAIQVHGGSMGWWKPDTVNYLFNGVDVNFDNAWLFLCCTAK